MLTVVAAHMDLRLSDMSSKRCSRSVVQPRQIAMYLSRRLTRTTMSEIAQAFGKHPSTVKHACATIHARLDVNLSLRNAVRTITQKLGLTVGYLK